MPRRLPLQVIISAAVLFAACTGPPDGQASFGNGGTEPPTLVQPPSAGGVLQLATYQCPVVDPAQDAWDTGNGIVTPSLVPEIHAGLMRFTDDPQSPIENYLADSSSVSDDYSSYRFVLKPDLRFSDGSPLTTHDFKASWERALKLGRERGYAHQMLGQIVGAQEVMDQSSAELAGVTVVDERTLEVDLAEPNANFRLHMAHPVAFVVKSDNAKSWERLWPDSFNQPGAVFPAVQLTPDQLPAGAGPFKLVSYVAEPDANRCVLSRNEHFHGIPSTLDHVVMTDAPYQALPIGFDEEAFDDFLEDGKVDINPWMLSSLSDEQIANIGSVPGIVRSNGPVTVAILGFNTNRPPLDDSDVRRTLLRNSDIVSEAYGQWYPTPNRILPELLRPMVAHVEPVTGAGTSQIPDNLMGPRNGNTYYIRFDSQAERFWYPTLVTNLTERWWQRFGIDFQIASSLDSGPTADRPHDAHFWLLTLQYPHPKAVLSIFDEAFGTAGANSPTADLNALFDAVDPADRVAEADSYAKIEQFILDQSLGITLDWDVGWMPIKVQPYVHGFTGATFPRSLFHHVWMDDTAPDRPIP